MFTEGCHLLGNVHTSVIKVIALLCLHIKIEVLLNKYLQLQLTISFLMS